MMSFRRCSTCCLPSEVKRSERDNRKHERRAAIAVTDTVRTLACCFVVGIWKRSRPTGSTTNRVASTSAAEVRRSCASCTSARKNSVSARSLRPSVHHHHCLHLICASETILFVFALCQPVPSDFSLPCQVHRLAPIDLNISPSGREGTPLRQRTIYAHTDRIVDEHY